MLSRSLALLVSLIVAFACAGAPLLEKADLFRSGEGGYALYRIPGIVVTSKGTVLAYCEGRKTGKGDWDTIDILLGRSMDAGRTWDPPRVMSNVDGPKPKSPLSPAKGSSAAGSTFSNAVAIADRNGSVHLLFCLEYMRCFYLRSDDDGVTFSKPVEITAAFEKFRPEFDWKVIATGPGHGIQLKNGRLVVPMWMSTGTGAGQHRPSVAATVFSDDHGVTWHGGEIAVPNTAEWVNPNETTAIELADGRVMLNVRSEARAHRRLVTVSEDGAKGWSRPNFDDALLEPICFGSLIRFDGKRILFSNPYNLSRADGKEAPGKGRDRKNLSVQMSSDEGATWPVRRSLEPEFSGYSDLAVLPDSTVLCFYERGSTDGKSSTRTGLLTMARFNMDWLTGTRAGHQ